MRSISSCDVQCSDGPCAQSPPKLSLKPTEIYGKSARNPGNRRGLPAPVKAHRQIPAGDDSHAADVAAAEGLAELGEAAGLDEGLEEGRTALVLVGQGRHGASYYPCGVYGFAKPGCRCSCCCAPGKFRGQVSRTLSRMRASIARG